MKNFYFLFVSLLLTTLSAVQVCAAYSLVNIHTKNVINLEGGCAQIEVMDCPLDAVVDCSDGNLDPAVLGEPEIFCTEEYTLSYQDLILSEECPTIIERTWTAVSVGGNVAECVQNISIVDEEAPVIGLFPEVIYECDFEAVVADFITDDCDPELDITFEVVEVLGVNSDDCDPGQLRTQTMGGWGSTPNGNNPGMYLLNNFDAAFPNGLTIGCENTLTLTSASAIQAFLPSGTAPAFLPEGDMLDPGDGYNNVLAGQLVAITISLGFDAYDPNFGASDFALAETVLQGSAYEGYTVAEIVELANQVIGGCGNGESAAGLNEALSSINENYVDGTQNGGFLGCDFEFDCAVAYTFNVTATDDCGNSSSEMATIYIIDETAPVITEAPENITVECGQVPDPEISFDDECSTTLVEVLVEDAYFSGTCEPTIQRTYTLVDPCGNTTTHIQYIVVVDTTDPVFMNQPDDLVLNCGDLIPEFTPEVTDNCGAPLITFDADTTALDCGLFITRHWVASDNCGNSAMLVQQIHLIDEEGPVAENQPMNLNVSCSEIPVFELINFVDACSVVVDVEMSEVQNGDGCEYQLVRSWIATDQCGNSTLVQQTINVTDDLAPTFSNVPVDMMLECGAELPDVEPVAMDQCGAIDVVYSEEWLENGAGCAQVVRTWTATDECQNSASVEVLYTFVDETGPVLIGVPVDQATTCEDLYNVPMVTAIDNCDGQVPVNLEETVESTDCQIVVTRIWTAQDDCGNVVSAQHVITTQDGEAPQFVANAEVTVECSDFTIDDLVEVVDDCDYGVEISFTDELLSGDETSCDQTIERVWLAVDACGNETSFVQLINVFDASAPSFTYVPADIQLSCGMIALVEEPEVIDNCSDVVLSMEEASTYEGCNEIRTRTWTAIDACGNTAQAQQVITFIDDEAPVFTAIPEDQILDCGASLPTIPKMNAVDDCSEVEISFNETTLAGVCEANFTVVRTWTATDACGNTSTVSQNIVVTDTLSPVFDYTPEDIIAECGQVPAAPVLTASDNCSDVTIVYNESADAGGCPNIYRTWTAIDACGNETTFVQTVFVDDTEPPVLEGIPSDMDVDCTTIPDMPTPQVSDNCDQEVAVTMSESIIGSGCEYTIIRTWIASDDCGNTTIVSQSINVQDTQAPIFVQAPAEVTVECTDLDGISLPQVTDDCAATVTITWEDYPLGTGCQYDIERVYTATDQCGQSATSTMLIHVVDTTPPMISGVGPNTFVDCNSIPDPQTAIAMDACAGVVDVIVEDDVIDQGACSYIINRSYYAEDFCGNAIVLTQLIYVSDESAPLLVGLPENITIDCTDVIPDAPEVTAIDNCSDAPEVSFMEFVESAGCTTIITRIWSAADDCGNQVSEVRSVTITDLTAPLITNVPADLTTTCDAIPEVVLPTATDNCDGEVTIIVEEEVQQGGCPYEIVRTFIATDACGNVASASQSIFVEDLEAPVLTDFPEDMMVACGELPEAPEIAAIDNCSGATVYFEENSGVPGCAQVITRTWTAVDLCGNTSTHSQTITVVDDAAPEFLETPEDITVNCLMVPVFATIDAYDACGDVTLEMNEYITETECASVYSLLRVWTAIDACGNTSSWSQNIEVIDDVAPILMNVPEDVTVDCSTIPDVPEVIALEGCGESVEVIFEETITTATDENACNVSNANGFAGDIALWLPGIDGLNDVYVYGPEGGSFIVDPTSGVAHLSGQVFNTENANLSWIIDIYLHEERTWEEWSELGRDYKDDLGIGTEFYQDWSYYILDGDQSSLIGTGGLEGNQLSLSHAPADSLYGFQLGMNANNRSEGFGLGGWFFYEGSIEGVEVVGMGDIFTEHNCCPEQEIIRTWTAIDCAGNVVSYTQTITVTNLNEDEPFQLIFPDAEETVFEVSGTEGAYFLLTFEPQFSGAAKIQLYTADGTLVADVFDQQVIDGAVYKTRYAKAGLAPGTYVFTVSGDRVVHSDTEMVLR